MTQSQSPYASKPWLKSYPASIPENIPDSYYSSLADWISQASSQYKNRIAFSTCLPNGFNASLTFAQVEKYSNNLAAFLLNDLKLQKGDKVAIQLPNCQTYPLAVFAILKAGLTIVNLNPLYTESETKYALQDSEAKAIIIIDLFAHKLNHILSHTQVKNVIVTSVAEFFSPLTHLIVYVKQKYLDRTIKKTDFPYVSIRDAVATPKRGKGLDAKPWISSAKNRKAKVINPWVNLNDVACLQYTGGTTGKSKGAILTHGNLLANMLQMQEFSRLKIQTGEETILTVLPLYHIFSFTLNCLFFYTMGARNILIPSPRPILNLQKAFQKFNITWITAVNTLYHALTLQKWFIKNPPKHLKVSVAGGMPLLSATAKKWRAVARGELLEGYGLTETSPGLIFNPIGGLIKEDCIGVPICSTEVKLVDLNGNEVPQGEPGELCAKGPQIMQGYWKNKEETEQVLKDGWFYTGDIAIMDKDGYFKIVDRKKDMILVSGFNVYPNEIEDCIQKIPSIVECAVIGMDDGEKGEAVKAFVVSKETTLTTDDVILHCRKFLTPYKIPKMVEFRDDLPKSPVGKILKRELRS